MQEKNYKNDVTIQVIAERINTMQNDVSDLKDTIRDSMKEMSAAITKLVQMEERQISLNRSHERLSSYHDKMLDKADSIEKRLVELEKAEPMQKRTSEWIEKAFWMVLAGSVSLIATIGMKFFGL